MAEDAQENAMGITYPYGKPKSRAGVETRIDIDTIESSKPKRELIPGGFSGVMDRAKKAIFGPSKPMVKSQLVYDDLTPQAPDYSRQQFMADQAMSRRLRAQEAPKLTYNQQQELAARQVAQGLQRRGALDKYSAQDILNQVQRDVASEYAEEQRLLEPELMSAREQYARQKEIEAAQQQYYELPQYGGRAEEISSYMPASAKRIGSRLDKAYADLELAASQLEAGREKRAQLLKGARQYLMGKKVYKGGKIVYVPGLAQRGAARMEVIAGGVAAAPKRFAGSFRGARMIERGTKRRPGLKNVRTLSTSVGGFLFPSSGLSSQYKMKGMGRGVPGRPRGVYTHIIPGVGPVHSWEYRRWQRSQRRRAQAAIQAREQAMAQQLAKKGLPLDLAYAQAEQYQQARRQRAMEAAPELAEEIAIQMNPRAQRGLMQQYYQMPQQYQPAPQMMLPQAPMEARAPINMMAQPSRAPINMLGPDRLSNVFRQQPTGPAPFGYKENYNVFNGQKTFIPKNEPAERWARDNSGWNRPDQLGFRRPFQNQGGYY